jgi:hypothetical protein
MRKQGREIHDPGRLIDRRGLHGRDLMLPQSLAHNLKPAG